MRTASPYFLWLGGWWDATPAAHITLTHPSIGAVNLPGKITAQGAIADATAGSAPDCDLDRREDSRHRGRASSRCRRALLSAEGYQVEQALAVLDQWMEDAAKRAAL